MTTTTHGVGTVTASVIHAGQADGDWRRTARCGPTYTQLPPETWVSDNPDDVAAAMAVCAVCPVAAICLKTHNDADARMPGVWGGVYFPSKLPPTRRAECGSHAGELAHKRADEQMCIECRDVKNAREVIRKAAHRRRECRRAGCENQPLPRRWYCSHDCQHVANVGSVAGYRLHKRLGEDVCRPCWVAFNTPGSRTKAVAPMATAA
jgi:hypothetical protein